MGTPWGGSYIRWSMPTAVILINQAKLYLGLPCWVPSMITDEEVVKKKEKKGPGFADVC